MKLEANSRYYEQNSFNKEDINIYFGAYEFFSSNKLTVPPFSVDYYALQICTEGSFYIFADKRRYKVEKGTLLLLPLYTPISKELISDSISTMYILLKGPSLRQYFSALGFDNENIIFPHLLEERHIKLFDDIIKLLSSYNEFTYRATLEESSFTHFNNTKNATARRMRRRGLFYILLAELFKLHEISSNSQIASAPKKEYIRKAIEFTEKNLGEDINVDKIAAHLGLNRSYLYKLFKSELGISVQDFIIQTKLRIACSLLKTSDLSIKSIALSINYDSITFSRIFRKYIGMTPTQYRAENGAKEK